MPLSSEKANFGADVIDGIDGFHDPERLIINNEIFSEKSKWLPEGWALTDEDEMPIDYWIDYIRLYQNPETEDLYLKDDIAKAKAEKRREKAQEASEASGSSRSDAGATRRVGSNRNNRLITKLSPAEESRIEEMNQSRKGRKYKKDSLSYNADMVRRFNEGDSQDS